jgi:putative DNA primase/helicase
MNTHVENGLCLIRAALLLLVLCVIASLSEHVENVSCPFCSPAQFKMQTKIGKSAAKVDQSTSNGAMTELNTDTDVVFTQYGNPFIVNNNGKVHLNERAVAVKCASVNTVKYDPTLKRYERFDVKQGLWLTIHETEVRRLLGDLLLKLGKEYKQEEFVHRNKTAQFSSLAHMLQPYQASVATEDATGLFHVNNGVVDLRGKSPKLLGHDAKYPFRCSPRITYDAKAKATRFVKELLKPALETDDIELVQKYCGSVLLGANTCHGILLIRGIAGGGKSTLMSIIEKVLGEDWVAHLRTKHLHGRFETSAFIGKRLLVGKDVPGDTLAESGARLLKSLVGGDLLQAEIKYNPTKQMLRGDFHVMIASNNRLRIALDGDDEAWRRRLLVVDFDGKKPAKPIPNFADKLFEEEASGILNWLIEGAVAYRNEMNKRGTLTLNEIQMQRVNTLLRDSDSVRSFVDTRLIAAKEKDVSSEQLLLAYYQACKVHNWTPVGEHAFQKRMPDLVLEKFSVCRRNDIQREGKAVRGYKHISLN